MFSYKAQVDDAMDEDTVSLPHQQSFSSLKTDSDYIYQVHTPSIYIPLYDAQAPISKPRASTSSLTPTKRLKTSNVEIHDSQVTYRSAPDIRNLARPPSTNKMTLEFANYSSTNSSFNSSTNLLDLKDCNKKAVSISHIKYGSPDTISNLLFSTDTASNLLYNPKENYNSLNLFTQMRKNLDKPIEAIAIEKISRDSKYFENTSELHKAPALENTLQSILDNETYTIDKEQPQENPLTHIDALVKTTANNSPIITNLSHLTKYSPTELSQTGLDDTSLNTEILNITPELLPNSFRTVVRVRNRNDSKEEESGGLNDYLLSVTSLKTYRNYTKHKTNGNQNTSPDTHS